MRKFAYYFARKLAHHGVISSNECDVFRYGCEVILSVSSFCLMALVISSLTGMTEYMAVFLMSFFILRCFVGGYHAETPEKCFAVSSLVTVLCLLGSLLPRVTSLIIVFLSIMIMWRRAPKVHSESLIFSQPVSVHRYRARLAIIIESVIFLALCAVGLNEMAGVMAVTYLAITLSLFST